MKKATFLSQLESKKIIVCCGSGGVGKTTTAAALGYQLALKGKKVLVLTIDPAKRLANALGMDQIDHQIREINIPALKKGSLSAMMLDTKRTFDKLIERHTSSAQSRDSILNNRLYQYMSNMIAGSQEYMAMERLYEIASQKSFDIIVLDTPPTRHALDFLEAPQKMARMTGNSLLQWLLKPSFFTGKVGFGLFKRSTDKILSVFDRLVGLRFLQELSEMFSLMASMMGGFHDRAIEVNKMLHQKNVGFLLVASTAETSMADVFYFEKQMDKDDLSILGLILNRLTPAPDAAEKKLVEEDLKKMSEPLRTKWISRMERYKTLAIRDQKAIKTIEAELGKTFIRGTIPAFEEDVHSLKSLERMGEYLLPDTAVN